MARVKLVSSQKFPDHLLGILSLLFSTGGSVPQDKTFRAGS